MPPVVALLIVGRPIRRVADFQKPGVPGNLLLSIGLAMCDGLDGYRCAIHLDAAGDDMFMGERKAACAAVAARQKLASRPAAFLKIVEP